MLEAKLERLRSLLQANTPMLIAYSGGVDSAFLLASAVAAIPGKFLAVIADSPSLPRSALHEALQLAEALSAPVEVLKTQELEDPRYSANPLNRCYFCKSELFVQMGALALEKQFAALAYGENADDANCDRPGRTAAKEYRVLSPLQEAGLTKSEIREGSRALSLPTHDKPAQPCLSSRIPHGTPVTSHALALVELGEEFVRSLGFRVFRVRYQEPNGALVQISPDESLLLGRTSSELLEGLKGCGFETVALDPDGYRSPVRLP